MKSGIGEGHFFNEVLMNARTPNTAPLFQFDEEIVELPLRPKEPFIHRRYLSINDQLAALENWGELFPDSSLPCTTKDLERIRPYARLIDDATGWSAGRAPPGHCLVIVPYLGSTVSTFRFLRNRLYGGLKTRHHRQPRFGPDDPSSEKGICLGPGITAPRRCLRVELIDLDHRTPVEAMRLKSSIQQRAEQAGMKRGEVHENAAKWRFPTAAEVVDRTSAHAGALAAYALHWPLAHQLDGVRIPHPILGGYRLTVSKQHPWRNEPPSAEPWQHMPMIVRSGHDEYAELIAYGVSKIIDRASVPKILRALRRVTLSPHD